MILPPEGSIDVVPLSRIFNNTVATYKYYWFVSIINQIVANPEKRLLTFNEIIAGMISEAWYPIHYFKLSFGKQDSLEENIHKIQEILNIPIDAQKSVVYWTILDNLDNRAVSRCLNVFTHNVPYRFLSPWIHNPIDQHVEFLSREHVNSCPYAIYGKTIILDDLWADYLVRYASILKDFSFWNLSIFLQKRNPNVPDIPSKLVRPIQRASLTKQHHFWDGYIKYAGNVSCIYTNAALSVGSYDLDHFVPWSFVVHDLMWNLLPADPSINSSKSNNLPSLDRYLEPMANLQHAALKWAYQANSSNTLLEDYLVFHCSLEELVNASKEQFTELFKNEFTPMMQTAMNMGFAPWLNYPTYD